MDVSILLIDITKQLIFSNTILIVLEYKGTIIHIKMAEKQPGKKSDIADQDLFNNPMVTAALKAMSPEEKEQYKRIGEQMYGNLNFEDARYLINPEVQISEALTCLEGQIRSGLHPTDMTDNEKAVLKDAYGEKWYEKWGFVEEDLTTIATVEKKN